MRYFLIRQNDGLITDVIIWDGISNWKPFDGYYVLPEEPDVYIGWRKIEGGWQAPPSRNHYWDGTEWKEHIIEETE